MKSLKNIKKHHIAVILIVIFILFFVIGRIIIVQERKYIFKEGQPSVCKVYKLHIDGEVDIYDGYYYFFYRGKKYFNNYIIELHNIKPVGKYYKVFFLPKNPNKNVVDYFIEIQPDSVSRYFPYGQNPFENELKRDSIMK